MRVRIEIILACASGKSGTAIARRLGVGIHTVSRLASTIRSVGA